MFHWQWLILVICIVFVISECDANRRFKKKRKAELEPEESIKDVQIKTSQKEKQLNFPLWVQVDDVSQLGAFTIYNKIGKNKYKIQVPFPVKIEERHVLVNKSAEQPFLEFPIWVDIDNQGENQNFSYGNDTADNTLTLEFPFQLEVISMSLMRSPSAQNRIIVEIWLLACGVVGGVVMILVRAAVNNAIRTAVEILTPHHNHADGLVHIRPSTVVGKFFAHITGKIVGHMPFLPLKVKGELQHLFQSCGDNLVRFIGESLRLHATGDILTIGSIILNLLSYIPFLSMFRYRPTTGKPIIDKPPIIIIEVTPPTVIIPTPPPLEPQEVKITIIICPWQQTIPGYPDLVIVWPGQPEPTTPGVIIIRPPQQVVTEYPKLIFIWPGQSPSPGRPNIIIIVPEQKEIPGYPNFVITWRPEQDTDIGQITKVRPGDSHLPNVQGIKLIWPNQPPNSIGEFVIVILPEQRQIQRFPNIIIVWERDPPPILIPGLIIVRPGQNIPGYPSIVLIWPGRPIPPDTKIIITVSPDDRSVPWFPNILIEFPNEELQREPGLIYIHPGQTAVPEIPEIVLYWPPSIRSSTTYVIYIPPRATSVPGFPTITIVREPPGLESSMTTIRPGDKYLPNKPTIYLIWLELPSDLFIIVTPQPPPGGAVTYPPVIDTTPPYEITTDEITTDVTLTDYTSDEPFPSPSPPPIPTDEITFPTDDYFFSTDDIFPPTDGIFPSTNDPFFSTDFTFPDITQVSTTPRPIFTPNPPPPHKSVVLIIIMSPGHLPRQVVIHLVPTQPGRQTNFLVIPGHPPIWGIPPGIYFTPGIPSSAGTSSQILVIPGHPPIPGFPSYLEIRPGTPEIVGYGPSIYSITIQPRKPPLVVILPIVPGRPGDPTRLLVIPGNPPIAGVPPSIQFIPGTPSIPGTPTQVLLIPGQPPIPSLPGKIWIIPGAPGVPQASELTMTIMRPGQPPLTITIPRSPLEPGRPTRYLLIPGYPPVPGIPAYVQVRPSSSSPFESPSVALLIPGKPPFQGLPLGTSIKFGPSPLQTYRPQVIQISNAVNTLMADESINKHKTRKKTFPYIPPMEFTADVS